MSVYGHRYPANYLVAALNAGSTLLSEELAVHQGRKLLFTNNAASGGTTIVGGLPILRDGFGGLRGFVRDLYEKTFSGSVAAIQSNVTLSGSTLTATYPALNVLWNGVSQTFTNITTSTTLTAPQLTSSTWYLCLQRNYGFSLAFASAVPQSRLSMCLGQVVITNSVLTISQLMQTSFNIGLSVNEAGAGAAVSSLIPVSNASGIMTS